MMAAALQKSDLLSEFGSRDAREREESWRYSKTALRALSQQGFGVADADAAVSPELRARFEWPQTAGRRIVFVNGAFSSAHSDLGMAGASVVVDRVAPDRTSLTIAGDAAEPLHLVYVGVAGATAQRWSATIDVRLESGAAQIVEQHLGDAGNEILGALNSTLTIAAGASLRLTTLSGLVDSASLYRRIRIRVATDARFDSTHVLLGGRLQRHDIDVELAGERSRYDSRGVFALNGRQHVDTHLDVRHGARDSVCDIVWRGIVDGRARGIFHGAIVVAEGADGADARLSNKNLLLSAQAEIDTQPVLEIYADEVKAAHGATVGQLDERALFYLRSRGIPTAEARRMLVGAFAAVASDGAEQAWLRERIEALLATRVAGEMT